jgi:threonine/homoserine/homoserine lactone efflux protein
VLVAGGNTFIEWVIVLSSTVPVVGLIWFAWWFLRAGKRYDEQERAAQNRPPHDPFAR